MREYLEVTDLIADIGILAASVAVLAFVLSYATFFNWRLTVAGRALMYFVCSLLSVAILAAIGRWLGPEYLGRELLRPLTWWAVAATSVHLFIALWSHWRIRRPVEVQTRTTKTEGAPRMAEKIIPDTTKLAAKRGFIRTTAQAYSTAVAGGISTTVLIGLSTGEVQPVPLAITIGVTLVSPILAGAASALSILSRGIPGEYVEAGLDEAAESDGFTTSVVMVSPPKW